MLILQYAHLKLLDSKSEARTSMANYEVFLLAPQKVTDGFASLNKAPYRYYRTLQLPSAATMAAAPTLANLDHAIPQMMFLPSSAL